MQPHGFGKFGSLVGWLGEPSVFGIPEDCRTFLKSKLSGGGTKNAE